MFITHSCQVIILCLSFVQNSNWISNYLAVIKKEEKQSLDSVVLIFVITLRVI